jgi:hypothetical protein
LLPSDDAAGTLTHAGPEDVAMTEPTCSEHALSE